MFKQLLLAYPKTSGCNQNDLKTDFLS